MSIHLDNGNMKVKLKHYPLRRVDPDEEAYLEVRILTRADMTELMEMMLELEELRNAGASQMRDLLKATKRMDVWLEDVIVGWHNCADSRGRAIDFTPEAVGKVLTPQQSGEFLVAVQQASSLTDDDRGNSTSP